MSKNIIKSLTLSAVLVGALVSPQSAFAGGETVTRTVQEVVCDNGAYGSSNCRTITREVPVVKADNLPNTGIESNLLISLFAVAILGVSIYGLRLSFRS